MYAAPIWLASNLDVFKDFWSRALLKISGSEYNPKHLVIEVATGIMPLQLILKEIALKFVLKYQVDPAFRGLFMQLETNRGHPFNHHVQLALKFVKWKRSQASLDRASGSNNGSDHDIRFVDITDDEFHYTKDTLNGLMKLRIVFRSQNSLTC